MPERVFEVEARSGAAKAEDGEAKPEAIKEQIGAFKKSFWLETCKPLRQLMNSLFVSSFPSYQKGCFLWRESLQLPGARM